MVFTIRLPIKWIKLPKLTYKNYQTNQWRPTPQILPISDLPKVIHHQHQRHPDLSFSRIRKNGAKT